MAAGNKFFTIMVVPEKTHNVRRIVIPSYIFKGGILAMAFLVVLATVMVLDYANVMSQISENKQLKTENRQLRQQVQIFKDKMVTIESTLDRVKTFATKLKIITNVEDSNVPSTMPSAPLLPGPAAVPFVNPAQPGSSSLRPDFNNSQTQGPLQQSLPNADSIQSSTSPKQSNILSLLSTTTESASNLDTDTSVFVQMEFEKLNRAYDILSGAANQEEQIIQEIYEQLSDKKSMLLSMPTRIPSDGYITSGFGIRFSPYGGKRKMHEGLDIANRYGADIFSPGDGLIIFAGVKPGYGKIVGIDHGYGLKTYFGHSSAVYVTKGQRVRRGQRIAAVGSTGRSTGPHLHYEIHAHGTPIDPMYYLLDR